MAEERPVQSGQAEDPTQDFNHRAYYWIDRHPLPALLLAVVGVAFLAIVYWAFRPQSAPAGTGFAYTVPNPGQQLTRTLWDWLGLLIVPLAVAAGAAFISYVQKRTELDIAEKAREEDREIARLARESEQQIATDRLRQATLEGYYDRMTDLLLEHDLRASAEDSEVRSIARARTVAVAKGLDSERKGQLLLFLKASGLIEKGGRIIDLREVVFGKLTLPWVDLSGANLSEVDLSGSDLRWADLSGANLSMAHLSEADLGEAYLSEANLGWAQLGRANLSKADLSGTDLSAAIMVEANLSETNLSGAVLRWAFLTRADLSGADLSEADLGWVKLSVADLVGADLAVAGAELRGANLSRATLTDAVNWTIEQFDQVMSPESTTMPDGVKLRGPDNPDGPTYEEWKAQYLANQATG